MSTTSSVFISKEHKESRSQKKIGIRWNSQAVSRIQSFLESIQWITSSIMIQYHNSSVNCDSSFICMEEKMDPSSANIQSSTLQLQNSLFWSIVQESSCDEFMKQNWSIRMTCVDIMEIFKSMMCGWTAFEWIRQTNDTFLIADDGRRYRCHFYPTSQPCLCIRVKAEKTSSPPVAMVMTKNITSWMSIFYRLAWIYPMFHILIIDHFLRLQTVSSDSELSILIALYNEDETEQQMGKIRNNTDNVNGNDDLVIESKRFKMKDRFHHLTHKIKSLLENETISSPVNPLLLWRVLSSRTEKLIVNNNNTLLPPLQCGCFYYHYYLLSSEWTDPQLWADHQLTLDDIRQLYTGFSSHTLGKLCMLESDGSMSASMIKIRDSLGDDHSYIGRQLEYTNRPTLLNILMKYYADRYSHLLSSSSTSKTRTHIHEQDPFVQVQKPCLPVHMVDDHHFESIHEVLSNSYVSTIHDLILLNANHSDQLGVYLNQRLPKWIMNRLMIMDEKKKKIFVYKSIIRWKEDVWVLPISINSNGSILRMQRIWIFTDVVPIINNTNKKRRKLTEDDINERQQSYLNSHSYEPYVVALQLSDKHVLFGIGLEESFFLCQKSYGDRLQRQTTTTTTSSKRVKRSSTSTNN